MLGGGRGRPALATLPAFAARAMFGEMADEAMLSGARVVPRKLRESGFRFAWAELEGALEEMLRGAKA
ncbi:DUF1731 domain-containing protein, partial [bacterium]|nr:DUF1731 domain-containing protein [bacterium]